jgi:hypothetical protein
VSNFATAFSYLLYEHIAAIFRRPTGAYGREQPAQYCAAEYARYADGRARILNIFAMGLHNEKQQ